MATGDKSSPICVTGASGYIAAHIVEQLLTKGYKVHGTVRDVSKEALESKYKYLLDLPNATENLTLFAADLNEEGCFKDAITGCQNVIHTASPYIINVQDPQKDLVDPAVNGTNNVLKTCKELNVSQVILTSSVAAVTDSPVNGYVYTEKDWNIESGLNRNPYYYSKTLAEKAAWKFVEELSEEEKFKLVVINPFVVVGPAHGTRLNPSNALFQQTLDGSFGGILSLCWGLVDVRDVARAHIVAMETEASNGRYLCCNCSKSMKEVVEFLRPKYPNFNIPTKDLTSTFGGWIVYGMSYFQPSGVGQFLRTNLGRIPIISNSKIMDELDFTFTPIEDTMTDTCEDIIAKGHVKPLTPA